MEKTKFTILGESLSGKTCCLLGMYNKMNEGINGYTIVAQDDDLDAELFEKFEKLDDESRGSGRFPVATDSVQKYLFNLNYAHKPIMPFEWIDYPGGLLREKNNADPEQYKEISSNIQDSSTLFICVDGALLVGDDIERKIRNVKRKCSMTINRYFGKYFEAGGKLPPVGIIITKFDLCVQYTNPDEIRKILEQAFSPFFVTDDTLIAVIPVSLGTDIKDDDYHGEVDPLNIHLPIFMGIWFALLEQINIYKYQIASNESSINDLKWLKDDEEDSFFLWRDDDKIRRLAGQISDKKDEIQRMKQLIKNAEENSEMFEKELNSINMLFIDGKWQ